MVTCSPFFPLQVEQGNDNLNEINTCNTVVETPKLIKVNVVDENLISRYCVVKYEEQSTLSRCYP